VYPDSGLSFSFSVFLPQSSSKVAVDVRFFGDFWGLVSPLQAFFFFDIHMLLFLLFMEPLFAF